MKCPHCGKQNKDVVRTVEAGPVEVIRHRRCKGCGTWRTRELLVPRSFVRDTGGIPTEHPQATGSTGVARRANSAQEYPSALSLLVDPQGIRSNPDQTHARKSNLGAEVFVFPVVGKEGPTWAIRETQDAELRAAFPDLDIAAQYRKSLGWLNANRRRRKTADGMYRFLFGWMGRAQNNGAARGNGVPRPAARGWSGPSETFVGGDVKL